MQQYFLIDSSVRTNNNNINDFEIILKKNIQIKKYVKLLYASIPNTQYNINSKNNKLVVQEGLNIQTLIIKPQQYTATSLATEIKNMLNNVFPLLNFNVVYLEQEYKFKFTAFASFSLILQSQTINKIIGFDYYNVNSIANEIQSIYTINLYSGKEYIQVRFDKIDDGNIKSNLNINLGFLIPITAPYGQINYFFNNTNYDLINYIVSEINFKNLKIQLYNADGTLFDNNNNDFILMFEYV